MALAVPVGQAAQAAQAKHAKGLRRAAAMRFAGSKWKSSTSERVCRRSKRNLLKRRAARPERAAAAELVAVRPWVVDAAARRWTESAEWAVVIRRWAEVSAILRAALAMIALDRVATDLVRAAARRMAACTAALVVAVRLPTSSASWNIFSGKLTSCAVRFMAAAAVIARRTELNQHSLGV